MPDEDGDLVRLADQLRDEVGAIVRSLAALLGPSEQLLMLEQQVESRAAMWASNLLGDDDNLAAETVIDLVNLFFPGDAGPDAGWWRTPLGRAAARSVGFPGADVVSYSVAGAMLGCTKQYIGKLAAAGRLDRGSSGGVTTASIRDFLKDAAP